jgi:hypothetical protein
MPLRQGQSLLLDTPVGLLKAMTAPARLVVPRSLGPRAP